MVSHLLFADDAHLLCGVDEDQLINLWVVLLCFEVITGLKINLGKSELISVEGVENIDNLATILSCNVGSLPATYLGLPLGSHFKDIKMWDPVAEKVERRLSG